VTSKYVINLNICAVEKGTNYLEVTSCIRLLRFRVLTNPKLTRNYIIRNFPI
jgi:hypothetical protein